MKYQLESAERTASKIRRFVTEEKGTLYVGLDIEKEGAMIVLSWNGGAPQVLGKDTRDHILKTLSELLKVRNILVGHGRCLLQEHGVYLVPDRWWGPQIWPRLLKTLDPWIVTMLEPHRKLILETDAGMNALEAQAVPAQAVADGRRPAGLGVGTGSNKGRIAASCKSLSKRNSLI